MKLKKLFFLIAIFFVIVAALIVKKANVEKHEAKEKQVPLYYTLNKDLATAFVAKMTVTKGDDQAGKVVFSKNSSGEWMVETPFLFRADKRTVESLLKKNVEIKGEVRAESKEVLGDFKINDKEGLEITLSDSSGKELSHLVVSLLRLRGTMNFVRQKNSNQVIATDTDFLSILGLFSKEAKLDAKNFRDLQIGRFETSKVTRLELSPANSTPFTLVKKEDPKDKSVSWGFDPEEAGSEIDKAKVESFLGSLSGWTGSDALDAAKESEYGFVPDDKPWVRVSIKNDNKTDVREFFLSPKQTPDKKTAIKVLPDKFFYLSIESAMDYMKKDKAHFLKEKTEPKKS